MCATRRSLSYDTNRMDNVESTCYFTRVYTTEAEEVVVSVPMILCVQVQAFPCRRGLVHVIRHGIRPMLQRRLGSSSTDETFIMLAN